MTGRPQRRGDSPNYEYRAKFWRSEIAMAATPQEQFRQVSRWLHAVARQAGLNTARVPRRLPGYRDAEASGSDIDRPLRRRYGVLFPRRDEGCGRPRDHRPADYEESLEQHGIVIFDIRRDVDVAGGGHG